MINRHRNFGLTLTEMAVVVAIAAVMVALTIPTVNMLLNSFESESGAKTIINAAMASARAIAAKEHRYAGIRFQKRYDPDNLANPSQYIIFIIYDYDRTSLENGFRAVEGIQPIKLPDSIGVMDLYEDDRPINLDFQINDANEVNDTTTFSIIFSPMGKLAFHDVQTRNRNGVYQPDNSIPNKTSMDDIFNSPWNITYYQVGMFVQDDYPLLGLTKEAGRNSFYIYETKRFNQTNTNLRWTKYLSKLKPVYINPYTGTIVDEK